MDYDSTPITATISAGTASTTVNVPLINDSIVEGPETFNLSITISPSLSGQVELGTIIEAIGNIIDDTGRTLCLIDTLYLTILFSYYHKI